MKVNLYDPVVAFGKVWERIIRKARLLPELLMDHEGFGARSVVVRLARVS